LTAPIEKSGIRDEMRKAFCPEEIARHHDRKQKRHAGVQGEKILAG